MNVTPADVNEIVCSLVEHNDFNGNHCTSARIVSPGTRPVRDSHASYPLAPRAHNAVKPQMTAPTAAPAISPEPTSTGRQRLTVPPVLIHSTLVNVEH